jgi:16S rRNA (cytosine967-C5)-methyltransferase
LKSVATPARAIALRVLGDVARSGALLADRLAAPDVEGLDTRDRAFLHELVLGTLRTRGALDHALSAVVDRTLARIDPGVLDVLRLGAYQILKMRVPDRAAVSEAVELAREGAPRATGFVNAALRRLAREGAAAPPDPATDPLGWLTTAGSLPRWLAERWLDRLGPEVAHARASALLEPPAAALRLNPRRPEAAERVALAGVTLQALVVPGAFVATSGSLAPLASEGIVYAQDQGSQLVAHLAARLEGRLLDACAAPGGKTTLLGDLGPAARVAALEVSPSRLATLAGLVRRWGAANVAVVGGDARRPPLRGPFDVVLVDAPCSGLGTLGRHPDIRWKARPRDLPRHAIRQREILEGVAPLVAPGGRLVYATCSVEPEENEGVLAPFLEEHRELRVAPLPGWAEGFRSGPFARTLPERDGGDAFFAAVLERV